MSQHKIIAENAAHYLTERLAASGTADYNGPSLKAIAESCGAAHPNAAQNPAAYFGSGIQTNSFQTALAGAVRPIAARRYAAVSGELSGFCGHIRAPDFKKLHIVSFLDFEIDEIFEVDEKPSVSTAMGASEQTSWLRIFGTKINVTRQSIINDEVGLISDLAAQSASACARRQLRLVYETLENNPTLSDSAPLFDIALDNVIDSAFGESTLAQSFGLLRTQPSPSGEPTNAAAKAVLVSPELELPARAILMSAGLSKDVAVIASAYLPAGRWYVFAHPAIYPVISTIGLGETASDSFNLESGKGKNEFDGVTLFPSCITGAGIVGRSGVVRGG